jgi:Neuraminidase (sialidase)
MKKVYSKKMRIRVMLMSTIFLIYLPNEINGQSVQSDNDGPQVVLKIGPKDNNPRNSEGDFIELKDGKLLYVYTHYYGESSSDHATAYLASRISSDGGDTWSHEDEIILENEGDMNVMSVSLLRLKSGEIAMFYLRKNSDSDCIPMMRISVDEAKTWTEAIACISDQQGYFVLNNDRVIQGSDGRILLAVSQHNFPDGKFFRKGIIYCYFSDDKGKTWQRSEALANPDNINYQEPGLVFLKDNALLMFIRTNTGTQCFTRSEDNGKTWGEVTKSQLISPVSPATIERIPSTGDLLAVWNNNLSTDAKISKKRIPLNIAISKDEGISWQNMKIIDGNPKGWFCYTAMQFLNNNVMLGYCAGTEKKHLTETHLTKIDLTWIYD